jgi:cytochrome c556
MKRKDDFSAGLEAILNNPQTSFIKNPKTFREIHTESGMSMSQMIKHIGRQSKVQKEKKPTDEERSKARLDTLEANSESK